MAVSENKNQILVSKNDCLKKGLIPLEIEFSIGALPLIVNRSFPAPNYITLSGPPGGPLGLSFDEYKNIQNTEHALRGSIESKYSAEPSFSLRESSQIELFGVMHRAILFYLGRDHARSRHCVILFPTTVSSSKGVRLDFVTPGGNEAGANCREILFAARYREIFESLIVNF